MNLFRKFIQFYLYKLGYQLIRAKQPQRSKGSCSAQDGFIPNEMLTILCNDNPILLALRSRYAKLDVPMLQHSWWNTEYIHEGLDLVNFRGDNVYVWQTRHMGADAQLRYYLYALDIADRDHLNLLDTLKEDGAFGCWTYEFEKFGSLSRDLLDSINELNFLHAYSGIAELETVNIVDIGAGYGRLAHRATESMKNLNTYYCLDAIPESTFLADQYLKYRGCDNKAKVVALDELDTLQNSQIDLAVNIHSFSEMNLIAIEGWLDMLVSLKVPRLLIVPNDSEKLLSMESDGGRKDFRSAIEDRGYKLVKQTPVVVDVELRKAIGSTDQLFLFQV